jgi:protein-L-isoaspartate(D-aspartate) O-methyltransferase
MDEDRRFVQARLGMVEEIVAHVRLTAEATGRQELAGRVATAMGKVPRHEFVPLELRGFAYVNSPLPIGYSKTISQPFINALMTDLLDVGPGHTVLEIGTGMGYQAALLAELAAKVFSVEIIEELGAEAKKRLGALGYKNIALRIGDGSRGWPQHAPFDRILVAAAPDLIPPALIGQLRPGGRMVLPAGIEEAQQLMIVDKDAAGRVSTREVLPVRFSALESYDGGVA